MKNSDVLPQHPSLVDPCDQDHRRRRWWFPIRLGGMALAPALLFYAQSEHALIHIYLPILSRRLGARVQAAGGSVRLNGRIHLTNLTLAGTYSYQPWAFSSSQSQAVAPPESACPSILRRSADKTSVASAEMFHLSSMELTVPPRGFEPPTCG